MRQDRFLSGILIFIAVLVVLAIGLFFYRQAGGQTYGPEDTPEGVLRNYVIALTRRDYARAYGYLAADPNKPELARFQQGVTTMAGDLSSASLQIQGVQATANDEATVSLGITRSPGGLFANSYVEGNTATLVRQGGAWKIRAMPYPYFSYDWYQPSVTPAKPVIPAQPAP